MNAAEQNDKNFDEQPAIGPGEQLRTARLAAGLGTERVAAQLHLKPAQVNDLERDHYDSFPARVFVRGYLRNYARLVGLPVDELLTAFDAVAPDPDQPSLKRVGTHKPQVNSRHGVVRLFSWLLVIVIVGLFGVWWAGYLELNGNGDTAGVSPADSLPSSTALAPPSEPGALPLPAAPVAAPAVASAMEEVGPAEAGVTTQAADEAEPVAEAVPAAAAEPEAPEEQAPVAESVPAVSEVAGQQEIVLTLTGPCWVEVRATDGSYKLLGEFKAGTRKVLGGNPPYRILLGNAPAATLTVDGRPFDLVPHTRQQVARFSLDPAAL